MAFFWRGYNHTKVYQSVFTWAAGTKGHKKTMEDYNSQDWCLIIALSPFTQERCVPRLLLDAQNHRWSLEVMAHTFNHSTWDPEVG